MRVDVFLKYWHCDVCVFVLPACCRRVQCSVCCGVCCVDMCLIGLMLGDDVL